MGQFTSDEIFSKIFLRVIDSLDIQRVDMMDLSQRPDTLLRYSFLDPQGGLMDSKSLQVEFIWVSLLDPVSRIFWQMHVDNPDRFNPDRFQYVCLDQLEVYKSWEAFEARTQLPESERLCDCNVNGDDVLILYYSTWKRNLSPRQRLTAMVETFVLDLLPFYNLKCGEFTQPDLSDILACRYDRLRYKWEFEIAWCDTVHTNPTTDEETIIRGGQPLTDIPLPRRFSSETWDLLERVNRVLIDISEPVTDDLLVLFEEVR